MHFTKATGLEFKEFIRAMENAHGRVDIAFSDGRRIVRHERPEQGSHRAAG